MVEVRMNLNAASLRRQDFPDKLLSPALAMPLNEHSETPTADNNGSTVKELLGEVDQIRETLKNVLTSLANVAGKLKAVEKEKRVSEKEVEAIRKQMRRIQNVKI
jgi:hypothetical protein